MKKTAITFLLFLFGAVSYSQTNNSILEGMLNTLSEVKSVSYKQQSSSSAPGDTLMFRTFYSYVDMYRNNNDTILGAKFSIYNQSTRDEIHLCYDENFSVRLDWDLKSAKIDTISLHPRAVPMAPFYTSVESLIKYALLHDDITTVTSTEYKDSTKVNIRFSNTLVEPMQLKPFEMKTPGKDSRFTIVLNNETKLPYKMYRKMPHQSSIILCSDIKVNNINNATFNAIAQIPQDFTINNKKKQTKPQITELEGTIALPWEFIEANGNKVSLSSLKSKVLVLQFTGIGCGPCHAANPFINKLVKNNMDKDFEWVTIETWSGNLQGIKRYKEMNNINHKFLMANKKIVNEYKVESVPSFLILNEERVIKKVFFGYSKSGQIEEDILQSINELLD